MNFGYFNEVSSFAQLIAGREWLLLGIQFDLRRLEYVQDIQIAKYVA